MRGARGATRGGSGWLVLAAALASGCGCAPPPGGPEELVGDAGDCAVASLALAEVQGLKVYAPSGGRYLLNAFDDAGVAQVLVGEADGGLRCVTCLQVDGGPRPERFKMQPVWHPSERWLFLAVERDEYSPPFFADRAFIEGQLQNGLWTNLWAVTPDGQRWVRLTDFRSGAPGTADGYTGPSVTPDGRRLAFSQAMDGNIFAYFPFGRWQLTLADFEEVDGGPRLAGLRDITPAGMPWNEPGLFSPDGHTLLLTGSTEGDAQGMDQYLLDVDTGGLRNLTASPTTWDEHGVFSPDGKLLLFMSAWPYRSDPDASKILTIKTEFMLMSAEGGRLQQLTHFLEPGGVGYDGKGGIAAVGAWSPDGTTLSLRRLYFPTYQDWTLRFVGPCGRQP